MTGRNAAPGGQPQSGGIGVCALVERAFQYRGDITVWTHEGDSLTGYLFNRNTRVDEPFVQLFETDSGREISIPYHNIADIQFTGRDAASASVKHFEDFQRQRESSSHPDPQADRARAK